MGNYCISRRQDKELQFDDIVASELKEINDLPLTYHQLNKNGPKDKSMIELLRTLNKQFKDSPRSLIEASVISSEIDQPTTDQQTQLSMTEAIISEVRMKTDYELSPVTDWILALDEINSPCQIIVYIKSVEMPNNERLNITRNEFILPCKPKQYVDLMNDTQTQCKLDNRIDQFKAFNIDEEKQEYKIYLSYKGSFLISAREFVYLKKISIVDVDKDIWCDASRSITDSSYPINKQKIRGDILLSGNVVQPLSNLIEDEPYATRFKHLAYKASNFSVIRSYSECDFKLNMPINMVKGKIASEMHKYVNQLYKILQ